MAKNKPVNIALVGCGRIAPRHALNILAQPNVHLAYVCDIKKERADAFATQYHSTPCYNINDVLSNSNIDVLHICTPSGLHAEMAISGMQSGKHVIVEKPMALKVEDAKRMLETSKRTGKKLSIVLQNRYNPAMRKLKAIVDSGIMGKIYLGAVTVRWFRPQQYYEDEWHGTRNMDGGALMNQSIHHIDALQWLMGMPSSVFCYKDTLGHKMEMEDVAAASLKFPSGALATIEASTICWPQNLEGSIALFGENGSVKVGGTALNKIVIWKIKGKEHQERYYMKKAQVDPSSVYGFSHKYVINDFLKSLNNGNNPSICGNEGIKSLKIVEALYKSAGLGKEVQIV